MSFHTSDAVSLRDIYGCCAIHDADTLHSLRTEGITPPIFWLAAGAHTHASVFIHHASHYEDQLALFMMA